MGRVQARKKAYSAVLRRHLLGVAASAILMGCSLAPFVESNSIDYSNTVEDVTNNLLVTNVLRGRDSAPLYFADLSQLRGSVTGSISAQTTIPVGGTILTNGPRAAGVFPWNTQIGPLSASTNPSFDIAPTNTKKFYQGLLQPMTEDLFAYFIEQKAASNVEFIFHLLVDSIDVDKRNVSWREEEFVKIADRWTESRPKSRLNRPRVVKLPDTAKNFGPPLPPDPRAVVQASSAGLDVKGASGGGIQLLKKGGGRALCFFDGSGYIHVSVEQNSVTKPPSGEALSSQDGMADRACAKLLDRTTVRSEPQPHAHYTLHLRSVEQIFYYLGALLDASSFDYVIRTEGPRAGCPRIPFFINAVPTDHTRFAVNYRGSSYYVADTFHWVECGTGRIVDYTLPILAVLNDLLNLNRDADEVPTTKATQAVGG